MKSAGEIREEGRRRRERYVALVLLVVVVALTAIEVHLPANLSSARSFPFVNSIFFFGLMNLNIVLDHAAALPGLPKRGKAHSGRKERGSLGFAVLRHTPRFLFYDLFCDYPDRIPPFYDLLGLCLYQEQASTNGSASRWEGRFNEATEVVKSQLLREHRA